MAFFIDYESGQVATRNQLLEAGVTEGDDQPPKPWHPIQDTDDRNTMFHHVMRKREKGIFIGCMCIRHTGRQASLIEQGWEEVPIEDIGVPDRP